MEFRGAYTVTVTPFTRDGASVDLEAMRRLVDWNIAEGVHGLIILGSNGEFLSVEDHERTALVEATVDAVAGRVPLLVGASNMYTPKAVAYSREAAALGADGLMILPPYYLTPGDDEIATYYAAICDAVELPIMLYNNPFAAHVDLSPQLVAQLARDHEQIRYIKEGSGDVGRVMDILDATDGVVNVFGASRIVASHQLGAVGFVDSFGAITPRTGRTAWELLDRGRLDEAKAVERLLDELVFALAQGAVPYDWRDHQAYSKALAAAAGVPVGDVRPPMRPFASIGSRGEATVEAARQAVAKLDALTAEIAPSLTDPSSAATA